jgi:hypothetical protein
MKRTRFALALIAVVVMAGCTSAEGVVSPGYDFSKIDTVAIVEVESADLDRAQEDQISNWFARELLGAGYRVIERHKVEALLKEQQFQSSDLTSTVNMARAGEIVNVPAVVMVSVPEFGNKVNMSAKMVDVETAEIIWIGEGSSGTGKWLATGAGALVGAGAGYALGGDSTGKAVGAGVGGAAGGAAGYLLTGDAKQAAQKAVREMAKTLPNTYGAANK